MRLREKFVALAHKECGQMEVTENRSPRILEYRASTTLGVGGVSDKGWAWCSAFVCWVQLQFMREHMATMLDKRCRSAAAHDWELWKFPGLVISDPKKVLAKPGDIVTFEFNGNLARADHVGIVMFGQKSLLEPIVTIEGNTHVGSTSRDGGNDGVFRMSRSPKLVRKIISWLPE